MDLLIATLIVGVIAESVFLIYLLRKEAPQTSNDDLSHTISILSQQVRDLAAEAAASRGEMKQLDTRLYSTVRLLQVMSDGILELTMQIIDEFNGTPVWEPPSDVELVIKRPQREITPEQKLTHLFGEYFNADELRGVSLMIGADYENLPGSIKQAKAQSLVHWAANRGRLKRLADIGKEQRPLRDWSI